MKILHLDIETAPNLGAFWRTGTQYMPANHIISIGYTLCWAAKWHGKREVIFDSVDRSGADQMVAGMHALLDEADAVCHYNGRKFDIKVLNAEFAKRQIPPLHDFPQIDLLSVVRSKFNLPSNKLDFVCRYFGLGSKVKHVGMDMWLDCMNGDPKALSAMERYNKQDVRLLEKLYRFLLPWIKNHPNYGLYVDSDRPVCQNCGSTQIVKVGVQHTKTRSYQRYRCKKCHTPLRGTKSITPSREVLIGA